MDDRPTSSTSDKTFVCTCCGNCCRGEGQVYVDDEDARRIAEALRLSVAAFEQQYCSRDQGRRILTSHPNHDCIFLEGDLCTVHEVKPTQCARWPFWRSVGKSTAAFAFAKSYCEGLGDFSFQEFVDAAERQGLYDVADSS